MPRIRHIEIKNYRCIKCLTWKPEPGMNCLIGSGDNGKSSIIDAIDLCLSARRSVQVTDADFYRLNVDDPISISITIGELSDTLKNIETYGPQLRSFDPETGLIEDEPVSGKETVLTLNLTIGSDLEPVWSLVTGRDDEGSSRFLTWADRVRIAPTRIGAYSDSNFSWKRGSVLNRLGDEEPKTASALAAAARQARAAFGDLAEVQLGATTEIVTEVASELGVNIGTNLRAMLDVHGVSFNGGTIALHGENGVPLRNLGIGSTRLLVAGLQRRVANGSSIILVDELEHGLEPHRIIRLLGSLGAKDTDVPMQCFATTHSPVALRELSCEQLVLIRKSSDTHQATKIENSSNVQGVLRRHPEVFLANSVLICEGATEIGFVRGIDQYRVAQGRVSFAAQSVALLDANGESNIYKITPALEGLTYRLAVLRDDDVQPDATKEAVFSRIGSVFKWEPKKAIEHQLFENVSDGAVQKLIKRAVEVKGESVVSSHIATATNGALNLTVCQQATTLATRAALGEAAKVGSWFKTVGTMEDVARDIIAPDFEQAESFMRTTTEALFDWLGTDREPA